MKLPIVVIETENGPVEMNESDFDEKIHKLYKEKPVKNEKKKLVKKVE